MPTNKNVHEQMITEVPSYEEVKKEAMLFTDAIARIDPKLKVFVMIEGTDIKHISHSQDMPIHEVLGMIQVAEKRIGYLDICDMQQRINAAQIQQNQQNALINASIESKFKN